MRTNTVRAGLAQGHPQIGTWLSLASPMAARFLARVGLDWITLDLEHSPATWETADAPAVASAGCVPRPNPRERSGSHQADHGCGRGALYAIATRRRRPLQPSPPQYHPMGHRSVGGAGSQ